MSSLGASGEDVDLWLDTELFLDVQLESGEWLEGETVDVNGRWVLVRFTRENQPQQWINVDTDSHRLAELHTRSGHENQAREAQRLVAAAANQSSSSSAAVASSSSSSSFSSGVSLSIDTERQRQAHEMYREVITRNTTQMQEIAKQDGEEWIRRQVQKRRHGEDEMEKEVKMDIDEEEHKSHASAPKRRSSRPAAPSKSKSCISPFTTTATASSSSESPDDMLLISSYSLAFPLFDLQTHNRMVIPVRSPSCAHLECFDLFTHIQNRLELSESQPIWTCPHCAKEAWSSELVIDPIIFHSLMLVRDGRWTKYLTSTISLTVANPFNLNLSSPLMSLQSYESSLAALPALAAQPPPLGSSSSSEFEERRLTLTANSSGLGDIIIRISTEAEDAKADAKRHANRRARTMPTMKSADAMIDEESTDFEGSPWKKAKCEASVINPLLPAFSGIDSPPVASTVAASSLSSSPPSVLASSSSSISSVAPSSSIPWPQWIDENGANWIDLCEGPDDIEGPDRWSRVKVKIENAHAEYAAVEAKRAEMNRPPPIPSPPTPPPSAAAAAASSEINEMLQSDEFLQLMRQLTPDELRMNGYHELAERAQTIPSGPPSYSRAATLPASRPSRASAKPSRTPSTPTRTKRTASKSGSATKTSNTSKSRAQASGVLKATSDAASSSQPAAAAASSSSAAAASLPKIALNRCHARDLQQIDGIGQQMAERIIAERYERWITRKVSWNDVIFEQQRAARTEGANSAPAPDSAAASSSNIAAAAIASQPALPPSAAASISNSNSAVSSVPTAASSLCECQSPVECNHVRGFTKVKTLKKIDGIGSKLLARIEARVELR